MREIKFRAKLISGHDMWVYGGYYKFLPYTPAPLGNPVIKEDEYKHLIIKSGFSDWNLSRSYDVVEVIPESVGQFTGLKDKNGAEIYESDLIKRDTDAILIEEVYWSEKHARFFTRGWKWSNGEVVSFRSSLLTASRHGVVVGNSFENPELLESKTN